MDRARILVADVSLLDDRFRAIFPDEELRFVRTVGEALRALDVGDYALAIIGMHFDDSKMFELLWNMKAKRLSTPVVCVQGLESALATVSVVETAARAASLRNLPVCASASSRAWRASARRFESGASRMIGALFRICQAYATRQNTARTT